MELLAISSVNVKSSESLSKKMSAKNGRNNKITDDVFENEIKKPAFRVLVQRNSIFRKLDVTSTKDVADIDGLGNVLKCGYCFELFCTESNLIRHLLTHDNRPYKLIQFIQQSGMVNQLKEKGKLLATKCVPYSIADAKRGCESVQRDNHISQVRKGKTHNKVNSKERLSIAETSDMKKTVCDGNIIGTELLNLSCSSYERQDKESMKRMLSCEIAKNVLSKVNQSEIPVKAMASVGKRKAKKKFLDNKKTKNKYKLTHSEVTDDDVRFTQKIIHDKSPPKKANKNCTNNCRLHTEPTTKLRNYFLSKDNSVSNSSVKVVQKETKICSVRCHFLKDYYILNSTSCHHNYYCSNNRVKTENHVITNIGIMPECSCNRLTIEQATMRTHRSAILLRCVTCEGCYLWKHPFLDHMKLHPNERPFECMTCKVRFLSFFHYITHKRNYHSPGRIHCCYKCPRTYSSWYILKRHLITHKACLRSKYVCTLCEKSFPYKYILSRHINQHLGIIQQSPVTLSCTDCGKSFKDRRNLWIHQKRHPNAMKPYECHLCHRKFAVHKWLVDHVQRHIPKRNYPCNRCGKYYFTKSDASMHERRHTKEAAFPCSECDKRFIYRSELNAHMKRHQGIRLPKNIVCDKCSKRFSTRRDLQRHLTIHTGEKPYKCHICSKCFSQEVNMHVHAKIHSGERPFQCDLCDKTFIAKSKLVRHRQCHNTSKGMLSRPFKCVLCPKKYTAENSLIRHLRTHRDSVEILANIKTALSKAVEESSTAQPTACVGEVLASMIDQAILDVKRMAHNKKNDRTNSNPSLAEMIDQAILDSKTTSSAQTPIVIDNLNNTRTYINIMLPSSSISEPAELAEVKAIETDVSKVSTDANTNSCSDLIKLISNVLSKHIEQSEEQYTIKSTLFPNPLISGSVIQPEIVKPNIPKLRPGQFVQINEHSENVLSVNQEIVSFNPLLEPITVQFDTAAHQTMNISLDQHDNVENLTQDVPRTNNKIVFMPVGGLCTVEYEQVILLDTLSEVPHMFQPSKSDSQNTYLHNILSINEESTLPVIMIPLSPNKQSHTSSLQNSTRLVQQFVLANDALSLMRKKQS